mgnify:CR=1 FL=1
MVSSPFRAAFAAADCSAGFSAANSARFMVLRPPPPLDPPPSTASVDVLKSGGEAYNQYCAACHGQDGQTRGSNFPNLMVTPLLYSREGFNQVVLKGVRTDKGMGSFSKDLKAADSVAVREYLIARANALESATEIHGV